MAEFHHAASMAKANGMEYEVCSPTELKERFPLMETHDLLGGLWDPLDGDIDPSQVTQAMARAARADGCRIRRHERVTALRQYANHEWTVTSLAGGVETEIECEIVINAGGYRAGEVMALIGRHMPIMTMSHQYFITEEIPELVARQHDPLPLLRDPDVSYYLRQERGSFLLGPYEWTSTPMWLEGIPDHFANMLWGEDLERLEPQILDAGERVPLLGDAGIAKVVNGPISYSPDGNPYIGPERGLRNFWHCNNFSLGIAQGGGAGKLLAEWILTGRPEWDIWGADRRRYKEFATTSYTVDKAKELYQNEYAMGFLFEERPAGRPSFMSPLYDTLKAKGASFGARGGWERATYFDPEGTVTDHTLSFFRTNGFRPRVNDEVQAARNAAAVFDLPGFAKFDIKGAGAEACLDHLLCTRLPKLGRVGLSYALLPDGKLLSEFTITRVADDHFYLVGAATAEWHDLDVLENALPADGSVTISNMTTQYGTLAVVGPKSREILSQVTSSPLDNASFPWLSMRMIDTSVGPMRALRVNYVGELGWELHASDKQLPTLYAEVMAAGAKHGIGDAGVYAIDSLRLDKCYRGWKGDLEIGFTPFDASLDRFVDMTKTDFVGKDALVAQQATGSTWRFVPLTLDEPGDADPYYCSTVFDGHSNVGIVTSGGWSYTLERSVALAYVRPEYEAPGTKVAIDVFGTMMSATVGAEPLFDPQNDRLRS
jgi:dimethylglycine dehydrogenase